MKVLLNNRISTYATTSTMVSGYPLSNIIGDKPTSVAKASGNVLNLSITTTPNDSTTIAGFNTNADTMHISILSVDDYVTNGDFALTTDWTLGAGWAIASGVAACDGTQVADSSISQELSVAIGNKYRVMFTVSEYTSGAITSVALGSTEVAVSLTDTGTHSYDIVATSISDAVKITANSDFVGSIDNVSVRHRSYHDTVTITAWAGWADWFDDFDRDYQRRDFWIDYEAMTEACEITIVLTSAAGTDCYIGPVRVDRAVTVPDPQSGLSHSVVNNDVQIRLLDASMYRRKRTAQSVFSGKFITGEYSDAIVIMQEISRKIGTAPLPWLIADNRATDLAVFGGLVKAESQFVTVGLYAYNFSIMSEV